MFPATSRCVGWCVEFLNARFFKGRESVFDLRKGISAMNLLSCKLEPRTKNGSPKTLKAPSVGGSGGCR